MLNNFIRFNYKLDGNILFPFEHIATQIDKAVVVHGDNTVFQFRLALDIQAVRFVKSVVEQDIVLSIAQLRNRVRRSFNRGGSGPLIVRRFICVFVRAVVGNAFNNFICFKRLICIEIVVRTSNHNFL